MSDIARTTFPKINTNKTSRACRAEPKMVSDLCNWAADQQHSFSCVDSLLALFATADGQSPSPLGDPKLYCQRPLKILSLWNLPPADFESIPVVAPELTDFRSREYSWHGTILPLTCSRRRYGSNPVANGHDPPVSTWTFFPSSPTAKGPLFEYSQKSTTRADSEAGGR